MFGGLFGSKRRRSSARRGGAAHDASTSDERSSPYNRAPEPEPEPDVQTGGDIWDMEGTPEADAPAESSQASETPGGDASGGGDGGDGGDGADGGPPTSARIRRTRTRLIGFETADGALVDPFEGGQAEAVADVRYPVGWLLVVEGPGRGHAFTLVAGMAQIGRGDDQAVQLDFGDSAISRNNHAAVVYDPQSRDFLLGHGGKANIVRLNGKPVLSNETLSDGDRITIGETVLALRTFCGPDFDWQDGRGDGPGDDGERDDVAIL